MNGSTIAGTLAVALIFAGLTGAAQKDGTPDARSNEHAAPMSTDGVPPVADIPAGSFVMGADPHSLPDAVTQGFGVMSQRPERGDFDEVPAHLVRIGHPFGIGITEVSPEEFRQFDPSFKPGPATEAYAAGISWDRAVAYCSWLSRKTGKPWRLPTEAEWEYVARDGGRGVFGVHESMPSVDAPNRFGVKNMGVGRPEWVGDWYGQYSASSQMDPAGAVSGYTRVVRGRRTGTSGIPPLRPPRT